MTDSHIARLPIAETGRAHSCACCSTEQVREPADAQVSPVSTTFGVAGMTCEHCVHSVTEELSEIPAVNGVEVALDAGGVSKVTVHSYAPVDRAAVAAAIGEAGYRLVEA